MGSLKKVVKKIARPKVILPLAALAIGGPMLAKAAAAKGAAAGAAGGAGGGLGGLFSSIFGGGAGAAGSGGLGSFLTSKKFLLPQLISAGTQLATTGKIDPKQQLLAAALSGVGSLGQGATAAEKAALAQRTAGMSAAEAAKLQAGYAGMSRDAAQALMGQQLGVTSAADAGLLASRGLSAAALPAINPTLAAQANPAAFQTFLQSAPLSQRLGQTAANLTRGLGQGLADPLSMKGLASYGALGTAGMMLNSMGKPQTEAQKNLGVDAQAQYDLAREMNRMMGGAYTDEQLNTITAPMLSQYGGEYETITGPRRRRRPMFPGLNYSGLTRYAADGGSIMPIARDLPDPLSDNEPDMETLQGIKDYIDYLDDMDAAREAMAERVPNPTGRADGGLMELAGSAGDTPNFMDRDEIAFEYFGKPYKELNIDELQELEEQMDRLRDSFMADGGSIPQTEDIPNGMQLDGRGGGFIPMGAKERKDDVPAMLAKNEFVMTADAVRAAGGGDVNKGAQKMYDLMNSLESRV